MHLSNRTARAFNSQGGTRYNRCTLFIQPFSENPRFSDRELLGTLWKLSLREAKLDESPIDGKYMLGFALPLLLNQYCIQRILAQIVQQNAPTLDTTWFGYNRCGLSGGFMTQTVAMSSKHL